MSASMEDTVAAWISAPEARRVEALRVLRGEVAAAAAPQSEGPLLLGMGQAAKYLGVSRPTMWRILQAGRLTKVEVLPGSFRMRRADLDAFAAGNTRKGSDGIFTPYVKGSLSGRKTAQTETAAE